MQSSAEAGNRPYAIGQVWAYKTRPGEENSTFTIVRIDHNDMLGDIFHIHISDVVLKGGSPSPVSIPHSPVSKETLDKSVTSLKHSDAALPLPPGYNMWKEAFNDHKAGVFTIPVFELVNLCETGLNKTNSKH